MIVNKNQPTFFVLPGYGQSPNDPQINWLIKFLKNRKYNTKGVSVRWPHHRNSEIAEEFKKFYKENKTDVNYILGFSYGAVVAFISAGELKPKKVFLCSLSPDFKEDFSAMKPWVKKELGKKRLDDTKSRSAIQIAKELKAPSVVFCGEKECKQYPQLLVRCKETVKLAKNAKLVVVKDAPHRLDFPTYIEAIKKEIELIK
ncbi:MAG: hypothetical protein WCV92_05330 [Candidatus Buchananbacteria bacterium]